MSNLGDHGFDGMVHEWDTTWLLAIASLFLTLMLIAFSSQTLPSLPPEANDQNDAPVSLKCSSCDQSIGQIHNSSEGYKLRKLALSVSSSSQSPDKSFESQKWLACHLLSSIDTQGVRKFLIRPASHSHDASPPIKIWVFNPDINISSSESLEPKPLRAVKILWKDADVQHSSTTDGRESNDNEARLDRQTLSEGEIELPAEELRSLKEALIKSANLLPEGSKMFQEEWRVALLPRFVHADLEGVTEGTGIPLR